MSKKRIAVLNRKKKYKKTGHFYRKKSSNECFPICLNGLSPRYCIMAIQPLEDNQ